MTCMRLLQLTNIPTHLSNFLGHFVAIFVAAKVDLLNKTYKEFPALFVVTQPNILSQSIINLLP